jgi:hypothetical protein
MEEIRSLLQDLEFPGFYPCRIVLKDIQRGPNIKSNGTVLDHKVVENFHKFHLT